MAPTLRAASRCSATELIETLNEAFDGYVGGTLRLETSTLPTFLARQGVDLARSPAALEGGRVVGLGLVTPLPGASRLATMAVRPPWQGRGVGRALLEHWLADAAGRGEERAELEVIGENAPALRLYERAGFRPLGRLPSLEAPAPGATPSAAAGAAALESVTPEAVVDVVAAHAADGLPWQITAPALRALAPALRGFRRGAAWALLTPPSGGAVTLLALVVEAGSRRRGHGTRLLGALRASHHDAALRLPALVPERFAGFFLARGFEAGRLWQWHMARATSPSDGRAR